jgi:hypothetical protein
MDTRLDVAAKIDWEGGIWQALEYGLDADDMPEGDTELRELWAELDTAFHMASVIAEKVEALLPDGYGG